MKFFKFLTTGFQYWLVALALASTLNIGYSQPVPTVNSMQLGSTTTYRTSINWAGLEMSDLAFYRFTDGYDLTAMKTSTNPTAWADRAFQTTPNQVAAFIAEKNGPIDFTSTAVNNATCNYCILPSAGMADGVRLKSSWSPYTYPPIAPSIVDATTTPSCILPSTPWFFLTVTMKGQQTASFTEMSIPAGMTIEGAIVKNTWTPMVGAGPFPIGDVDVEKITYINPEKIKIHLTSGVNTNRELNVYLVVKSATTNNQPSSFSAQLFTNNRNPIGTSHQLALVTHLNPHDPNVLTPSQESTCMKTSETPPLHYRVDFQNLGAGNATAVSVRFYVDTDVIDLHSFSPSSVTSSHNLTATNVGSNLIQFDFGEINLPGMAQDPQPLIEKTTGWLEFSVNPNRCIRQYPDYFTSKAVVTFYGTDNFFENVETKTITQKLTRDCVVDLNCDLNGWDTRSSNVIHNAFTAQCYPTIFDDYLQITTSTMAEDNQVSVTMTDLAGKMWQESQFQTAAQTEGVFTMSTFGLPSGMYLVHIKKGNEILTLKAIKK